MSLRGVSGIKYWGSKRGALRYSVNFYSMQWSLQRILELLGQAKSLPCSNLKLPLAVVQADLGLGNCVNQELPLLLHDVCVWGGVKSNLNREDIIFHR